MKKLTMLILILPLIFEGCHKDTPPATPVSNLDGIWDAVPNGTIGYQCPIGTFNTEIVEIATSSTGFTATKLVGDPCVPADYTSFTCTYSASNPTKATPNLFNINWTTGAIGSPGSSTASGTLTVVDDKHLTAFDSDGEVINFVKETRAFGYFTINGQQTYDLTDVGVTNAINLYMNSTTSPGVKFFIGNVPSGDTGTYNFISSTQANVTGSGLRGEFAFSGLTDPFAFVQSGTLTKTGSKTVIFSCVVSDFGHYITDGSGNLVPQTYKITGAANY